MLTAIPTSKTLRSFVHSGSHCLLTVFMFFTFLLINSPTISAQTLQWQAQFNGPTGEMDEAVAVKTDVSGNVYVTGSSRYGDSDIITVKYNASGVQQWTARYDRYMYDSYDAVYRHSEDKATDLQLDVSGNIYVTITSFLDFNCSVNNAITIKYNSSGVKQWEVITMSASCGGSIVSKPRSLVDVAGNVYVVAAYDFGFGNAGINISKLSSAGASLWSSNYTNPAAIWYHSDAVKLDGAGNIIIVGSITSTTDAGNYLTLKYNNAGTLQWQAQFNGPTGEMDAAVAVKTDVSGNVYVTGSSQYGDNDIITVKYNASGVQQWTARYDRYVYDSYDAVYRHSEDKATDLQLDASGNTYVTITSFLDFNCSVGNAITIKYNASGAKQWEVITASSDCGAHLDNPHSAIDASGNIYITESFNQSTFMHPIKLDKLSSAGALLWTRTYLVPGVDGHRANAISLDIPGNMYITGGIDQDNGNYLTLKYAAQQTTRINAGGPTLATSLGTFSADAYSSGSTATGSSTAAIAGTTDDALYQTYRRGNTLGGSFTYSIPVVNGNYNVNLHFAELVFSTAGQRKFNVSAEGVAWLSSYDIAAAAGINNAIVKTKLVTVTDGYLTLNFTSVVNYALISAIEIIAAPAPTGRKSAETTEMASVEVDQKLQAYPNPFTDKVTFSFSVPQTSLARLDIYNLQGQLVKRVFEGEAEGGKLYELEMDGANMNNGLYISRLITPHKTESKKIILAR